MERTRVMGCMVEVSIRVRVVKWGWRGAGMYLSSGL